VALVLTRELKLWRKDRRKDYYVLIIQVVSVVVRLTLCFISIIKNENKDVLKLVLIK
jgi:hypothetical protein